MPPVIEARGLVRDFGRLRAVDGLDLTVDRGEMVGLVGPDGAGKTTAIRLLTGVLAPTAGQARVLGRDLVREREQVQRRVGYLSQSFSLYGDLTVDENIEFSARIHDVVDFRQRREDLLEFTRMAPFRRRLAEQLSGGMKQKLALACTLIHQPELLFLDEPTTGVDPVSRRDFWVILADLLRRDIAIVMTTPYLDEAERCSRVVLMHRGRAIRGGAPRALAAALPGTLFEVRADRPRDAWLHLGGDGGGAQRFGERVHVRLGEADADIAAGRLRSVLAQGGFAGAEVRRVAPSLEDAFIEWVRQDDAARERSSAAP